MTIRRVSCIGVALVLASVGACGSKKDDGAGKAGSAGAAGSAETVVTGEDLFPGTTLSLPAPAAKLKFGMTEAEAKAAAPEIFAAKYGYDVPGTKVKYSSIKIAVQIAKDRLWNTRAELLESQDSAKVWMTKKWGPPVEKKNSIGTPELYWSAPAAGLRAKLEQRATSSTVYFEKIMSRDQLLGTDPKHFAFDVPALIGAAAAEASKALAAYQSFPPEPASDDPGRITIQYVPTENDYVVGGSVSLRVKAGKVSGYTFSFGSNPKDTDALVAKLESIYGPGKPEADMKIYTDYPGPVPVKAEIRRDDGYTTTVWVGDYRQ